MRRDPPPPPPAHDPPGAPVLNVRRHAGELSRTWELELLISGAVLFALLQLPARADQAYARLAPHLAEGAMQGAFFAYYFGKLALYTLIVAFLVHLAARAYWVGLIGLDSVFPGGIQWDRLRYGPLTRQVQREKTPSLPRMIDAADDFCSVIFPFAFMVVFVVFLSLVVVGAAVWLSSALAAMVPGVSVKGVFYALAALAALPAVVGTLVDRALGDRVDPASAAGRVLRWAVGASTLWGLLRIYSAVYLTLYSNVRRRVMQGVFLGFFLGIVALFVVKDVVLASGMVTVGGETYLPDSPGELTLRTGFYESLRGDGPPARSGMPSIPSEVVEGPYVRLFVPYVPMLHNRAVAARCPGVRPLHEEGMRRVGAAAEPGPIAQDAALRCLAGFHLVAVDGRAVPEPRWRFFTHPATGRRGIVAYLPVEALPAGEHVLTVGRVPDLRPRSDGKPRPAARPWSIPFWR